jgi:hypothetical protein
VTQEEQDNTAELLMDALSEHLGTIPFMLTIAFPDLNGSPRHYNMATLSNLNSDQYAPFLQSALTMFTAPTTKGN